MAGVTVNALHCKASQESLVSVCLYRNINNGNQNQVSWCSLHGQSLCILRLGFHNRKHGSNNGFCHTKKKIVEVVKKRIPGCERHSLSKYSSFNNLDSYLLGYQAVVQWRYLILKLPSCSRGHKSTPFSDPSFC